MSLLRFILYVIVGLLLVQVFRSLRTGPARNRKPDTPRRRSAPPGPPSPPRRIEEYPHIKDAQYRDVPGKDEQL